MSASYRSNNADMRKSKHFIDLGQGYGSDHLGQGCLVSPHVLMCDLLNMHGFDQITTPSATSFMVVSRFVIIPLLRNQNILRGSFVGEEFHAYSRNTRRYVCKIALALEENSDPRWETFPKRGIPRCQVGAECRGLKAK